MHNDMTSRGCADLFRGSEIVCGNFLYFVYFAYLPIKSESGVKTLEQLAQSLDDINLFEAISNFLTSSFFRLTHHVFFMDLLFFVAFYELPTSALLDFSPCCLNIGLLLLLVTIGFFLTVKYIILAFFNIGVIYLVQVGNNTFFRVK